MVSRLYAKDSAISPLEAHTVIKKVYASWLAKLHQRICKAKFTALALIAYGMYEITSGVGLVWVA